MPDFNHGKTLELIEADWIGDRDNRRDALNDLRFAAGDQWDQAERNTREAEGRPCLTINHMGKFVNQVAGDLRQAQVGIDVFPVDSKDDINIAKIYKGLIRQIEYRSRAQTAYAHGATGAVQCGIGHWRIETKATDDSPFEQDIFIDRILDPLSVVWDANAVKIDKADADRAWVTQWIHKTAWQRKFPKAKGRSLQDVPVDGIDGGGLSGLYWKRDDFVRIAEYWYVTQETRTVVMLRTGQIFDITEWPEDEVRMLRQSEAIIKERTDVERPKVARRMMDGTDWLDDEEEWAGRMIPIIPVQGHEIAFDGKLVRKGLIRDAKDPQKLLNYWRSASAELVGKAPKQPWLVTPKMVQGYEGYWSNANRSNAPFLLYKPDPEAPTLFPRRQDPPTAPLAILQEANLAVDDMKSTTSIFDAGLGARSNETSGRAILARQREGDVANFIYSDNFAAGVHRTGQILVDLIPKIYDTQRQIRVLAPDDEEAFVPINTEIMSADGEPILVNDLSHGRYDVRIKTGASYTTARIEAREQMEVALQGNPGLWAIIGDLVFKNSDYQGSDEIAERIRNTIDPKILGEDDDEEQPDPMADPINRLALAREEGEIAKIDAETKDKTASAAKKIAETEEIIGGPIDEPFDPPEPVIDEAATPQAQPPGPAQPIEGEIIPPSAGPGGAGEPSDDLFLEELRGE